MEQKAELDFLFSLQTRNLNICLKLIFNIHHPSLSFPEIFCYIMWKILNTHSHTHTLFWMKIFMFLKWNFAKSSAKKSLKIRELRLNFLLRCVGNGSRMWNLLKAFSLFVCILCFCKFTYVINFQLQNFLALCRKNKKKVNKTLALVMVECL